MKEIGLRYKGKKCPFHFNNPRFIYPLKFDTNDTVVWINKEDADWLIGNNPRMFDVMGEKDSKPKINKPIVKNEGSFRFITPEPEISEKSEKPEIPVKRKPGRPKGAKNKK